MPIFGNFLLLPFFGLLPLLLSFADSALTIPFSFDFKAHFSITSHHLHQCVDTSVHQFCLLLSPAPDSLIALLVYLQISQFAPRLSIWHRPEMSQWSDKRTDVVAFCSAASL